MSSLDLALARMHASIGATINRLGAVAERVAVLAAPVIEAHVQQQYAYGRDPYGMPWKPLRPATLARGRRPPPLTDTGLMRNTTTVRPRIGRPGIVIRLPQPGVFHQLGTRHMVARPVLPSRGVPRMWADALRRASLQAMREAGRP